MNKIATMIFAASAFTASVGAASAQTANAAPNAFESVVPFAGSGPVFSGRSAYVGGVDTSRVYADGPDGQGRLAPHINGIF